MNKELPDRFFIFLVANIISAVYTFGLLKPVRYALENTIPSRYALLILFICSALGYAYTWGMMIYTFNHD